MLRAALLAPIISLILGFPTPNAKRPTPPKRDVTLYRDGYGTPSLEARSLADGVYGLGYAMATDSAERMALNYKQARGRMAEVVGKPALLTDGFIHALGLEEVALDKARTLSGEQKLLMDAFCEGANRALDEQKGKLPDWIEHFNAVDVLALAQLVNASFPLQDVARQIMPGAVAGGSAPPSHPLAPSPFQASLAGSNQYAVAPKHSANGHAILSMDPHLPWDGLTQWYEYSLYCPQLHFHGITFTGLPFGSMGHTDRVAWCMTNNNPSLFAFFTVKVNPANPKQYSYHGEWRDFETVTSDLKYRENGELKNSRQTTKRTAWGPMVPFRNQSVKLSMIGSWELLDQSLAMARAKDAGELREALRSLGLSMWNVVYADTKGTTGYQYCGRVPKRDESFDWNRPVPGDDPRTMWGPLMTIDELPHLENPSSGVLVNCNSDPKLTPVGPELAAKSWPSYVTSYGHTTRYDRLSALVSADPSITSTEAKGYATDTLVPGGLAVVRELKGAGTSDAIRVLSNWDGRADATSVGTALYLHWLLADRTAMIPLALKAASGQAWSGDELRAAQAALAKGAESLKAVAGKIDAPWGDVHFSQRNGSTAPVSGFALSAEMAAVVPNMGQPKDGKVPCTVGSSFRMIVDLDPRGVKSWSILPFGDAANPASPHHTDQQRIFGRGEYKDTVYSLNRIRKEAASKQRL